MTRPGSNEVLQPDPAAASQDSVARTSAYDADCRLCPRLAQFLDQVAAAHPEYWARPVPSFGPPDARFLIVGLAPGMHGANATGRPFTGDWCGPLLYTTLHRHGFASKAASLHRGDGLSLNDCRIANAVKCLPPANKPELSEIRQCNGWLTNEIALLPRLTAIMALGTIAHRAVVEALGLKVGAYRFAHGAKLVLPNGATLFDSYHVSRYNTNTGRLTEAMFDAVVADVRMHIDRTSA
ncbi:MAG: uracil-DNA glycosylase [Burkholderiaceae bacterium]